MWDYIGVVQRIQFHRNHSNITTLSNKYSRDVTNLVLLKLFSEPQCQELVT